MQTYPSVIPLPQPTNTHVHTKKQNRNPKDFAKQNKNPKDFYKLEKEDSINCVYSPISNLWIQEEEKKKGNST